MDPEGFTLRRPPPRAPPQTNTRGLPTRSRAVAPPVAPPPARLILPDAGSGSYSQRIGTNGEEVFVGPAGRAGRRLPREGDRLERFSTPEVESLPPSRLIIEDPGSSDYTSDEDDVEITMRHSATRPDPQSDSQPRAQSGAPSYSRFSNLASFPRQDRGLRLSDSGTSVSSTISRDNTAGEHARHASLLAQYGNKINNSKIHRSSGETPSLLTYLAGVPDSTEPRYTSDRDEPRITFREPDSDGTNLDKAEVERNTRAELDLLRLSQAADRRREANENYGTESERERRGLIDRKRREEKAQEDAVRALETVRQRRAFQLANSPAARESLRTVPHFTYPWASVGVDKSPVRGLHPPLPFVEPRVKSSRRYGPEDVRYSSYA